MPCWTVFSLPNDSGLDVFWSISIDSNLAKCLMKRKNLSKIFQNSKTFFLRHIPLDQEGILKCEGTVGIWIFHEQLPSVSSVGAAPVQVSPHLCSQQTWRCSLGVSLMATATGWDILPFLLWLYTYELDLTQSNWNCKGKYWDDSLFSRWDPHVSNWDVSEYIPAGSSLTLSFIESRVEIV